LVVFTLKTTGAETIPEIDALEKDILAQAEKAGLSLIARTHLTYNRQEFTVFFEKTVD
jgi:formate-dependent phosphoribosylglycinamide formyltransferase (GAR transformylase)